MTLHTNLRGIAVSAVAALAMTLGAGLALAQPAGAPYMPGGPHGPGGMHGPGPGEQMIGHLIANARTQLNLNTMQQSMFDTAVADSKAARGKARALHQKVRDAMQAELAKPEPDLAAVARIADDVEQQARALRQPIRDEWLNLYATFSPEQKATLRDLLQKRITRAESFRQRMHEWMQNHLGAMGGG